MVSPVLILSPKDSAELAHAVVEFRRKLDFAVVQVTFDNEGRQVTLTHGG